MNRGKIIIIVAIAALAGVASCTKQDTLSFACTCNSSVAGGAKETYIIRNTSEDNAREQCESYDEPPTDLRNSCVLE